MDSFSFFDYIEEIFIVLLLIGANGLLSMLEMALVSSRKTLLQQQASEGNANAGYILKLSEEPTDFLSTVQIGITLVGIGTGVYSGAALAEPLTMLLLHIPFLEAYANAIAYTSVVALVTYLSIILGELIPKQTAINNPEKIIVGLAPVVKILITVFAPLTATLSISTRFLLRFLKTEGNDEPPVTEEDVRSLVEQGTASGIFNTDEEKIIKSAFELDDLHVREIMTPRTKISWLDINDDTDTHLAQISEKGYSCFIVADEDLDRVKGIIYTKKFLMQGLQTDYSLEKSLKQPLFVPETMSAQKLLNTFRAERIKIALVVNEFGSLAGMVTLRDVVEHLLGDVPSYDEDYEPEIKKRSHNTWYVDGLLSINEFVEHFDLDEQLVEESINNYDTVGGLMVDLLGYIPNVGAVVELGNLKLEVVDMDGKRIDKIIVSKTDSEEVKD
ncbi:MAG: hemolysin family protein [bacterium]|nr:hemolysin family protein [bacterium]